MWYARSLKTKQAEMQSQHKSAPEVLCCMWIPKSQVSVFKIGLGSPQGPREVYQGCILCFA